MKILSECFISKFQHNEEKNIPMITSGIFIFVATTKAPVTTLKPATTPKPRTLRPIRPTQRPPFLRSTKSSSGPAVHSTPPVTLRPQPNIKLRYCLPEEKEGVWWPSVNGGFKAERPCPNERTGKNTCTNVELLPMES